MAARLRWIKTARPEQLTPQGDWRCWLVMAGRGWGKSLSGAQDLAFYGLWNEGAQLAVIAPTYADARDTCVEGPSGLLSVIPHECLRRWNRSSGELVLFNGSRIKLFSADQPDRLRGPQHHRVWCDELGAWNYEDAFDQMMFGLRLGADPKVVVTTTPRPTDLLRKLAARANDDVKLTRGRTADNAANLPAAMLQELLARYAGTRLGRQELEAELLDEAEGALWNFALMEDIAAETPPPMARIVIGVDPAVTHGPDSDETGIVAAGLGVDGLNYVLADWSVRDHVHGWAQRVATLYRELNADLVVAEVNEGGDLVEQVLRQTDPLLRFKPVRALRGKAERALPVAALYEQKRVRHAGHFPEMERQMMRFTSSGVRGSSPDRVDALVWALTELNAKTFAPPRVRSI